EAFAAQALAVLQEWDLAWDDSRLNTWGSGISLGHPVGATGARMLVTLAHRLQREGGKLGLATMCIGGGQGMAAVVETEGHKYMARWHCVEYRPRKAQTPQDALVCIGSIGSTVDMWLPQLDALSDVLRVIAVDRRGHGQSPIIERPASIADLASDVRESIEKLGVDTYGVIGLSLGGAVAQYLAANDPKVTSAAFLCTAPKFGTPESWHERAR